MRHCKARTCESPIRILLVARMYKVIQEFISIFLEVESFIEKNNSYEHASTYGYREIAVWTYKYKRIVNGNK
jgi:hypothetical protein